MHLAEGGGPSQHVRPWLAALADRGSLDVVAPRSGFTLDLYRDLATTHTLPYSALTLPNSFSEAARLPMKLGSDARRFRELIRATRPGLVVVVSCTVPSALAAARRERVPTIAYVAEILSQGPRRRRLGLPLIRLTASWASVIVTSSDTVAGQLPRSARRRARTIYPGIDADAFSGADAGTIRRRYRVDEASPCLAVVGNITHGRAQDVAVRALSLLRSRFPAIHCLFAGIALDRARDRRYESELRKLVGQYGLDRHVTFAGFVPNVADIYAAADIVLSPARVPEGFGRVAVEALAAHRPVVATRVGAIPEILRDGQHALLVEPGDAQALAVAVTRLWEDVELREHIVERGREHVIRAFDERESTSAFLDVVDTCS